MPVLQGWGGDRHGGNQGKIRARVSQTLGPPHPPLHVSSTQLSPKALSPGRIRRARDVGNRCRVDLQVDMQVGAEVDVKVGAQVDVQVGAEVEVCPGLSLRESCLGGTSSEL